MLDRIKKYMKEHKLDIIENGSMVVGAIIGVVIVIVGLASKNSEPIDDQEIVI